MPIGQLVSIVVGTATGLVVLAGLVARQRLARCRGFAVYLSFVLVTTLLFVVLPDIFYWRSVWGKVQFGYALLRHVVGLELAFHTFRAFPAARRLARSFLWAMTILALAAPLPFLTADFTTIKGVLDLVLPMNLAALSLLFGLSVLILWYRLPLEPMHKAIVMGLVPYLSVYSLMLKAMRDLGPNWTEPLNTANTIAWLALCVFWAIVAWRPRRADDLPLPAPSQA